MMLKLFLATALAAPPVFGDTLLSGSIYFDSENTLLEVQDLIKNKDTGALARLFNRNHISDKLPKDLDIVLLRSGTEPESAVEFHLPNDPTTYWTYRKYVKGEIPKVTPTPSPGPNSNLPSNLPSSLIDPLVPASLSDPDPPEKGQGHVGTKHYVLHRHHRIKRSSPVSPTLTFWQRVKRTFAPIF
jgi:hypothetical protein